MKISIKEILAGIAIIAILAVAHYFLPYRLACAFDADSAEIHIFGLPFILGGLILLSIVALVVLKAKKRPCPQLLKKSLFVLSVALGVILPITYNCVSNHEVGYHGSNYGVLYNYPYKGVANQWGKVIIEPNFEFINIAYDNSSNKTVFICCNVNKTENSSSQTAYGCKMFFTIFSESSEVIENREGYFASSGSTVREFLEDRYSNIKPLGYGRSLEYTDGDDDYLHIDFLDAKIVKTKEELEPASLPSEDTNNSSSGQVQQPQPQRHVSHIPVQVWKDCCYCMGSGICPQCSGKGYTLDFSGNYQNCPLCGGGGRCIYCAGHGGQYETEYKTRVDYY